MPESATTSSGCDETPLTVLREAVGQLKGQSATARALRKRGYDCGQSTVRDWLVVKGQAPAEAVPHLSVLTGIPRYKFRPDLWEPPSPAAVSS
ncbi:MAG: hypothetical protein ACF8R7_18520 [Phycisphaerales bacterium JB039]